MNPLVPIRNFLVVLIFLGVGYYVYDTRVDFSEDHLFTLSVGSRNVVKDLSHTLEVEYFAPLSSTDIPAIDRFHVIRIRELVEQLSEAANGRVRLKLYDTTTNFEARMLALENGILRQNILSHSIFWGMKLEYRNSTETIQLFESDTQKFVEYEIVSAIHNLIHDKKPIIYLMSPLPLMTLENGSSSGEDWSIIQHLQRSFDVRLLDSQIEEVPEDASVLALVHPKNLSNPTLMAIDRYLVKGGNMFLALDSFARVELSSLSSRSYDAEEIKLSSHLEPLLENYGLRFSPLMMVGDRKLASKVNMVGKILDYPYFMEVGREELSKSFKITSFLEKVLYAEGGFFEVKNLPSTLKMNPFLTSSEASGEIEAGLANFRRPEDLVAALKPKQGRHLLGGVLSGTFPPYFEENANLKAVPGKIAFIGDVDMLHDKNTVVQVHSRRFAYKKPKNDNLEMIIGLFEFLGGSENLFSIRSRDRIFRSFDSLKLAVSEETTSDRRRKSILLGDLKNIRQRINQLEEKAHSSSIAELHGDEAKSLRQEEAYILGMAKEIEDALKATKYRLIFPVVLVQLILLPLLFLSILYFRRFRLKAWLSGMFVEHENYGGERRIKDRRSN